MIIQRVGEVRAERTQWVKHRQIKMVALCLNSTGCGECTIILMMKKAVTKIDIWMPCLLKGS